MGADSGPKAEMCNNRRDIENQLEELELKIKDDDEIKDFKNTFTELDEGKSILLKEKSKLLDKYKQEQLKVELIKNEHELQGEKLRNLKTKNKDLEKQIENLNNEIASIQKENEKLQELKEIVDQAEGESKQDLDALISAFKQIAPLDHGLSIDIEMVIRSYRLRLKRSEFPVSEIQRPFGKTHFKFFPTGIKLFKYLCWEFKRKA